MSRAIGCMLLLLAAQLMMKTMAQLSAVQPNSSCCNDVGPPTITLDRLIIAPSEYSDTECIDFLNSRCQFTCSVPADAYGGPNTLDIHWEFNSSVISTTGAVSQEIVLESNPPYALLTFDNFTEDMNGEYTCYSSNNHSSDNATVKVIGPPGIVSQEEPITTGTTVVLTWKRPNSFGAAIIYYSISYERVDMETDIVTTRVVHTPKDALSFIISGFSLNEIYEFKVAAVNEYGVTGEYDEGVIAEIGRVPCPVDCIDCDAGGCCTDCSPGYEADNCDCNLIQPPTRNPPCQALEGCKTCTLDVSGRACCSECDTENSFTLDGCDCFEVVPSCVAIEGCMSCTLDDSGRTCCSECDSDNGFTLDDCSCAIVNEVSSGGLSTVSIIAGIVVSILVVVGVVFFFVFILVSRYYNTKKSSSELELEEI